MSSIRELDKSFSSGELAPELYGRIDLAKFQSGLATCRNFVALPHGPAVSRPGTEYIREVKTSANQSRLMPFSYTNTQTFAIEIAGGYFRFYSQGGVLLSGSPTSWVTPHAYIIGDLVSNAGTNYYCLIAHTSGTFATDLAALKWYAEPATGEYEIPNPYATADIFDIHFVQSADVLTLVHPSYSVRELRRYGATNWQLFAPTFTAPVCGLTSVAGVASPTTGALTYNYLVTGVNLVGLEETLQSSSTGNLTNDLTVAANKNTINWVDPIGYVRYNVYALSKGIYGYIGTCAPPSGSPPFTMSPGFVDNNITPNISLTPPLNTAGFNDATNNYPGAVSYVEQRRCFAGTNSKPQNTWMTTSGTESNMTYSIPVKASDSLAFRVAAREASAIRHIVPMAATILLTATSEWKLFGPGGVLTPTSISLQPQSYVGSSNVSPIAAGSSILYAQARGGHIREMTYSWQAQTYQSNDVCLLAPHLFDYLAITQLAFARAPYPILWAVSSNGGLLGMTYVPEQQINSWHRHDTINGAIESVCTVSEIPTGEPSAQDMLYLIVKRTINGVTKRYVERLHTRYYATLSNAFFVDCGVTYSGAPANVLNGLTWLEGQTVSILADGAVCPQVVVVGGMVSIPNTASVITVGLPITADMQTLPMITQSDESSGQGKRKNIQKIWIRLTRSSGISVGPNFSNLVSYQQRTTEAYGSPPNLISDEIEIAPNAAWGSSGQVCLRQTDPLPLLISDMTIRAEFGG